MKNNNTNIILIISTLLVLIFIGSFVFLFNIIRNKNKHTSVVIATLDTKIKEKENIGVLDTKIKELKEIEDKINGFVVDTSKIDSFVEYLENLGFENDFQMVVRSVDVPKNEKNKINVGVNMIGDFENVIKGLALLENSPYNLVINNISLNKEVITKSNVVIENQDPETSNKIKWNANISFSVLSN